MSDVSASAPKHRWLHWVGLAAGPLDPEAWMPIASAPVTERATGSSVRAARVAAMLADEGIETVQRHYVLPDHGTRYRPAPDAGDRIRVALMVHSRDVDRARRLIANLDDLTSLRTTALTDEELTRQALAAGEEHE